MARIALAVAVLFMVLTGIEGSKILSAIQSFIGKSTFSPWTRNWITTRPPPGGNWITTRPPPGGNWITTRPPPGGNQITTRPPPGGNHIKTRPPPGKSTNSQWSRNWITTRPPPGGNWITTRPPPGGNWFTTRPPPGGNWITTRPPPGGNQIKTRPPPGKSTNSQWSRNWITTRPPPGGNWITTRPPPGGNWITTRPPPGGNQNTTRPPPGGNQIKTRPPPGKSTNSQWSRNWITTRRPPGKSTNSQWSRNWITTRPPPRGNWISTRPPPGGNWNTTRPPPWGNNITTRPPPGGNWFTTRPPPGGNWITTRPPPGGNHIKTRPPPGKSTNSQWSRNWITTRPPPGGNWITTRPPPGGNWITTRPPPGGNQNTTRPPPGGNQIKTRPPPGKSTNSQWSRNWITTRPSPGKSTNSQWSRNWITTRPPPRGNWISTRPPPGGNWNTTRPPPGGNKITTRPPPGGNQIKTRPPPGKSTNSQWSRNWITTRPPPGGTLMTTLFCRNQNTTRPPPGGNWITTRPPPGGNWITTRPPPGKSTNSPWTQKGITTRPPPGGNWITTRPPPGGNQITTRPPPGGNQIKTRPPPGKSTNSQWSRNWITTRPPPGGNWITTRPPPGGNWITTRPPPGGIQSTKCPTQTTITGRTATFTITTQAPIGKTTPTVAWSTKKMNAADQKKFNSAFDPRAMVSFTGSSIFDSKSGNVSDDFLSILDSDEVKTIMELQSDWKDVIDMGDMFKDALPEDVQFFTQQFENMDKNKLDRMVQNPNTIQKSDLKGIPLQIIGAMNESVRVDKLSQIPQDSKDELCKRLQNDETDFDTTKRIAKGIDCSSSLKGKGVLPKGSLARAIAANKVNDKDPKTWTHGEWRDAIKDGWFAGLPDGIIARCPSKVIKDNMRDVTKIIDGLDKKIKDEVMSKVKDASGGMRNLSASDISDMGDMVKDMNVREMKTMNSSVVRDSISTFRDNAKSMSRAQKVQVRKALKDSAGGAGNLTSDDVINGAAFIARDRDLIKKIDKDVLIANISDLGKQDIDRKSARNLAKKLRESADYDEPKDFDTTKFKDMGNLATGFSKRFVKNMTNVDFGSLLNSGDLKDMDFSKDSSKAVVQRVLSDSGKNALDQNDLKNLGKNVKGLRIDDVDKISSDDLATALDDMKDTINDIIDDIDPTTVDSMIKKVEGASGGLGGNLEKIGCLLQKVPVKKLKALSDSDFGDMSGQTERKLNCSKDTCPVLYEQVNKTIGQPGLKNPNFTMSVFINLGKVMCGMSVDDLKLIPATKSLEDIVGHLISLDCLSDKQERILAEKLKYRLGLFSGIPRTITSQDVKKFGGLMKHFKPDDLDQLGKSLCEDISLEIGSTDLSNVKRDDLKDLTKFVQECVNNTKDELSSDDITAMGDLVIGLSTDRVSDIKDDAMEDVINNVQKKSGQFSAKEKKTWAETSMNKLNVTSDTLDTTDEVILTQLGTFIAELSSKDLDKIPNDIISSTGSDLVDQFNDRKEDREKREKKGMGKDVTDADNKDSKEKEKKFYVRLIDAFSATASKKRKRSVSSLSCDDMQLLGSGVTALSTDQIDAMSDSDFLDCASFLGGYSTWTSSQLAAFISVATRSGTFGASSGWTADDVTDAGIITQGLTSSEIDALTDLTLDAMSSIGQHAGWGETQLDSGFSRWLGLNKGNDASTVTSSELIALGHFACGASTSHIGQLSDTEYSYAASYIGALTSCAESQLEAYADLAETTFGSISSWDTSVVSTVGAVIGGLTSVEIGALTTSQIAAIDTSSVAQIPSTSFVGFTTDQLSSFSVAQAQSTTSTQHSGLSTAQLNALIEAGATVESSAMAIKIPFFVVMLSVILSTLFTF